jgi:hypothetical protein
MNNNQSNIECRFYDNDELKYSLRSVERFAPWVNKIYIVTDNQVPEWLNVNHPKIRIVDHTEIMPPEALPTFNSIALEARLHHIKGLSEHFLYANDDMFFAAPVEKGFFFDERGLPIIRVAQKLIKKRPKSLHACVLRNAQNKIFEEYGFEIRNYTHHNIDAYLKSGCLDCAKRFEKEFEQTMLSTFRKKSNISRAIYDYYMIAEHGATFKVMYKYGSGIPIVQFFNKLIKKPYTLRLGNE